jgi:hypothetical protein
LLETIGEVHRIARGSKFSGSAKWTDDRQTGVNANTHLQGTGPAALKFSHRGLHGKAGADGSNRIIFPRLPRAKNGHNCITNMFFRDAPVGSDDLIKLLPNRAHEIADVFSISFVDEGGEAREVSEQNRDLLAFARRNSDRRFGLRRSQCGYGLATSRAKASAWGQRGLAAQATGSEGRTAFDAKKGGGRIFAAAGWAKHDLAASSFSWQPGGI